MAEGINKQLYESQVRLFEKVRALLGGLKDKTAAGTSTRSSLKAVATKFEGYAKDIDRNHKLIVSDATPSDDYVKQYEAYIAMGKELGELLTLTVVDVTQTGTTKKVKPLPDEPTASASAELLAQARERIKELEDENNEIKERVASTDNFIDRELIAENSKVNQEGTDDHAKTTQDDIFLDCDQTLKPDNSEGITDDRAEIARLRRKLADITREHDASSVRPLVTPILPIAEQASYIKPELTSDLADLLFDLKRNKEEDILSFNDDLTTWLRFRNQFEASVHAKRLPPLEKLNILMKKLVGKNGKAILGGITYASENYDEAWKLVKKFFHHPERLVRIELENFHKPLDSRREEKGERMRELINKTNRLMNNLKIIFSENPDFKTEEFMAIAFNASLVFKLEDDLDENTKLQWKNSLRNKKDVPNYAQLIEFMETRASSLEYFSTPKKKVENFTVSQAAKPRAMWAQSAPNKVYHYNSNSTTARKCPSCDKNHSPTSCPIFRNASTDKRWAAVKLAKLCANCLKHEYSKTEKCRQPAGCTVCGRYHHQMLHPVIGKKPIKARNAQVNVIDIFAPTAIVTIKNADGVPVRFRCLFDSGAEVSFISSEAVEKLKLKINPIDQEIFGIGGLKEKSFGWVEIESSGVAVPQFEFKFVALVIEKTVDDSRGVSNRVLLNALKGLKLADEDFENRGNIDIILGVSELSRLLLGNTRQLTNSLIALESRLGWLLCGRTGTGIDENTRCFRALKGKLPSSALLDEKLRLFWEMEDEEPDNDQVCNEFYTATL